jgi:hypothetical protein
MNGLMMGQMDEMILHDVLYYLMGGGKEGVFFQVAFVVESGLSTVHFPLGQWAFDFPCKLFFGLGGERSKEFPSS